MLVREWVFLPDQGTKIAWGVGGPIPSGQPLAFGQEDEWVKYF